MKLLAIESATIEVGIAVRDPSGLLAALVARPGRHHVEALHPAVEAVCAAAGARLDEIELVAVDVGPGLFTGIRVGVAAAKAFAFALDVPVVACTSIEVLSHACRSSALDVVPVIDMKRGELAWALPGSGPDTDRLRLGTVDLLADELTRWARPVLVVGDGLGRYGDALEEAMTARGAEVPHRGGDELCAPPVASLADLALLKHDAGLSTTALEVVPTYLRAPDTRINWVSRPTVSSSGVAAVPVPEAPARQRGRA